MAETREKTLYIVLKEYEAQITDGPTTLTGQAWSIVGTTWSAHNALHAKMQAAEVHGTGTYAATPASSWKTKPLKASTKTVVEVAEAG